MTSKILIADDDAGDIVHLVAACETMASGADGTKGRDGGLRWVMRVAPSLAGGVTCTATGRWIEIHGLCAPSTSPPSWKRSPCWSRTSLTGWPSLNVPLALLSSTRYTPSGRSSIWA